LAFGALVSAAKKARRRGASPHPGVVLIAPSEASRHDYWRARYRDADTGRMVKVKLETKGLPNQDARVDWAKKKSKSLAKRRMELESGAPRFSGSDLADTIGKYFDAHGHLRERTKAGYQGVADKLKAWASKHGITSADDLTRARLIEFRDTVIREKRQVPVKEGKRGEWTEADTARSPHTINRELRAARTVLGYLRSRDLLPRMSNDDLRDGLKRISVSYERVDYLKPAEIRKLLEAAQRHDAETFVESRDEHAGLREKGTTTKYDPIAPFVATVLLTGMRVGEAAALDWRAVELKALDHDGKEVGEIYLGAASTKTKRGRTIDLEVSPALRLLLARRQLATGGKGPVFGLTRFTLDAAAKRLRDYGAPRTFNWQALRRTCAVYLTNAPGIFGASSAYRSAKQLGHSVIVAERHYVDVAKGIPRDARTLEDAMQCAELIAEISKAQRVVNAQPMRETQTQANLARRSQVVSASR